MQELHKLLFVQYYEIVNVILIYCCVFYKFIKHSVLKGVKYYCSLCNDV